MCACVEFCFPKNTKRRGLLRCYNSFVENSYSLPPSGLFRSWGPERERRKLHIFLLKKKLAIKQRPSGCVALSCSGTFLSSTHSLRCARSSKQVDRLSYYHNRKKRILVLTDAALILLKRKGKRENYQAHRNILSIVYLLLILDWKNKFFCVITIRFRVELTRFQKMTAWNSFHSSRFYPFFSFLELEGRRKPASPWEWIVSAIKCPAAEVFTARSSCSTSSNWSTKSS